MSIGALLLFIGSWISLGYINYHLTRTKEEDDTWKHICVIFSPIIFFLILFSKLIILLDKLHQKFKEDEKDVT